MSDLASTSTALPTQSESDGSLLPSPVPSRTDLRKARFHDLEVQAKVDPDCNSNLAYPRKPRKVPVRKHKPPKDTRIYKAAISYIALKAQGYKQADVAEQMGLSVNTLKTYVHIAYKKGFINHDNFVDPEDKLEIVLASKAVNNLNTVLSEEEMVVIDKETGEREGTGRLSDRAVNVTLEVAKGLGMLKQHQVQKTTSETNVGVALKVDVQMPINAQTGQMSIATMRPGSFGGKPYFADAELVENEK